MRAPSPVSPLDSSHDSSFPTTRSKARLSRPPNLPTGYLSSQSSNRTAVSPPPTYAQFRNIEITGMARPERRDRHVVRQASDIPSVQPAPPAPSTHNLTSFSENLRYGDVSRQANLKNRISTVSQYPVLMNAGASTRASTIIERRQSRRRPISIASTSSAGIYLAVGQLPGSEPFDLTPPSEDMLVRHEGRAAPLQSIYNTKDANAPIYETAQAVRVLARTTPNASTTSVNALNRVSVVSAVSEVDVPRRNRSSSVISNPNPRRDRSSSITSIPTSTHISSARRPSVKPSSSWPTEAPPALGRSFLDESFTGPNDLPPPPPPKDPGYVKRVRVCSSTPHFPTYLANERATQREGFAQEAQDRPSRNWFGTFGGRRSPKRFRSPVAEKPPQKLPGKSSSNRTSQLLVTCARFIGRAMPKVTGHKGSS